MRRLLDALYRLAGLAAALSLIAILGLVVLQMLSRLLRTSVAGTDEFAAYALAATTFLALAPAFKKGAHIRVKVILDALPAPWTCVAEIWALAVGFALVSYFSYWSVDFVVDSWRYGELATAMVATPLWIPRTGMALGLIVFAIALADELVRALFRFDVRRGQREAIQLQVTREL